MEEKSCEIKATKEQNEGSCAALFMRIIAWVSWIGGFFLAYTEYQGYSGISALEFVKAVIVYGVCGGIFFSFAEVIENINTIARNTTTLRNVLIRKEK